MLRKVIFVFAVSMLTSLSAGAADTFKIDPVHSSIVFKIKHFNASFVYGRFNDVEGKIVFDEANPAGSSVELDVKAESADTHNAARDEHIKKPDFLDSKQFPTISFKSSAVAKGRDADSFDISGDFTLHGVTKPVKVTFVKTGMGLDPKGNTHIGFEGSFTIKRSDYGINFMPDPKVLGDEIPLMIAIEAVKQ